MKDEEILKYDNVPISVASKYLATSQQYIRIGLQKERLPFGSAVQVGDKDKWTYQISPGALIKWKNGESLKKWFEENEKYFKALISE